MHAPLFSFSWGRGHQAVLNFVCCTMCVLKKQHATQLLFVLRGHQASRVCWVLSVISERQGRIQSLRQFPWKVRTLYIQSRLLFTFLGRNQELRVFSWLYGAVLVGETMARGCHKVFYQLWCGWFCAHMEYKSLLFSFWISRKWNWSMDCCRISVSVGEKGSQASYYTILLKSNLFLFCNYGIPLPETTLWISCSKIILENVLFNVIMKIIYKQCVHLLYTEDYKA